MKLCTLTIRLPRVFRFDELAKGEWFMRAQIFISCPESHRPTFFVRFFKQVTFKSLQS